MRTFDRGLATRIALAGTLALAVGAPAAAVAEPSSLDDLLERVRQGWQQERAENAQREEAFRTARSDQKRLLAEAHEGLADREARFSGSRWAVITNRDAVFGMTRMFELKRDAQTYEVGIFRESGPAAEWLGVKEPIDGL